MVIQRVPRVTTSSRRPLNRLRRTAGIARPGLWIVAGLVAVGLVPSGIAAAGSSPRSAAFPVTIAAANGAVKIAKQPQRIISLSPSATDMLFSIGAGHQVVAVDEDSTYPSNAPKTSLSGITPNVEAIAKYRPDLVVVSYDADGIVKSLAALSIPVLVEPSATSLAASYAQLSALGRATGHLSGATAVVSSMRAEIAKTVAGEPVAARNHSYYYEIDQTYYSATSQTFIGGVLSLFHLRNIADGAKGASGGYPQLSEEYIVKADPQLIFLADTICCHQSAKTVAARPGWSQIAAVRDGAVVPLNDNVASQWGPHIVTLVSDVEQALQRIYRPAA